MQRRGDPPLFFVYLLQKTAIYDMIPKFGGENMQKRIVQLLSKYREIVLYLVCGVLTSAVNFAVYFPLYNWLHLSASVSNVISWIAAVATAFLTNKPLVFRSFDWSFKAVWPEMCKFVGCRILSGVLETVVIFVAADLLQWNGNWVKIITSVAVVIANYVASKYFVFQRTDGAS